MKLVILFGPHAVGKMTVGQELAKATGLKLFHNHMTMDIVLDLFENSPNERRRLVDLFRHEIFNAYCKTDEYGMIFTFMWSLDSQSDWDYINNLEAMFAQQGAQVYYVELAADFDRRIERNKTETETEKLITRVGEVYQRQLLRQRQSDLLRVQLMQERMNPHLLYNFLTSVKMSALRNGDEQLATLSQTMAAFFAEAVSNGENDLALVASELNMANQFILLSNLLYGKEITLMVKVEPHLRHGKILRHIIQPLVENAYKHGFAQQANGIIKIIGKQEGGYRQITVIDTGCGMDEDTCRALENGGCKRQRGGYAMANLYQRMKLFYGQTACIQVFSIPGQGSSIRLLFK